MLKPQSRRKQTSNALLSASQKRSLIACVASSSWEENKTTFTDWENEPGKAKPTKLKEICSY